MQQSYSSSSYAPPEEATESTTATSSTDARGNQHRAETAGLAGGEDDRDYGLAGEFAALILDALPLGEAVEAALPYVSNPAVREWLQALDPATLLASVDGLAARCLDAVWPVGTGVTVEGEIAGAIALGTKLKGSALALRTGADQVRTTVDLSGAVGIRGIGEAAGVKLEGALGDALIAARAACGADLVLADHAEVENRLDPLELARQANGLGADIVVGALTALVPGGTAVLSGAIPQAVAGRYLDGLRGLVSPELWDHQVSLGLHGKADAEAAADPLELLPVDLPALLDQVPVLGRFVQLAAAVGELAAKAEVDLVAGGDGVVLVKARLAAAGDLRVLREFPEQFGAIPEEVVALFENRFAAGVDARVEVPVDIESFAFDVGEATLSMAVSGEAAGDSFASCSRVPLSSLGAFLEGQLPGGSLDDMLLAGASFESVESTAVDETSAVFGTALAILEGLVPDGGLVAADSEIAVRSRTMVGQAALGALAGQGIEAPDWMKGDLALQCVVGALRCLASGGSELPDWLEPHRGAIEAAAAEVAVEAPRLVGTLRFGAGGSGSVAGASIEGSATARGSAGIAVDRELTPEEAAELGLGAECEA